MRNTRFIFVEGIMGAGKSTTAWFLTEQINGNRLAARFLAEGPTIDEPEHPLRIATTLPHPQGVWLDITIEQFIELSLQRWRNFAQEARQSSTVTVCDGLLFHGNMTDLLLMNAEPEILRYYIEQIIKSIAALNPVIIYLYQADIAHALRAICEARGSKWEAYQVNWKTGSPYAVQSSLHGFEGLVQLYQNYRDLCDDIFARLELPKLAILNEGNWDEYYRAILTFLQLPPTS